MEEFETYEDYWQYVLSEWESGAINELEEVGLIKVASDDVNERGNRTIDYRPLTEEEFTDWLKGNA